MATKEPAKQWAAALGRMASGLFVITARQGKTETGMLASWVQQCSFEPPLISLAIRAGRDILELLTPGATFAVNILDATQTDMIIHFGRGFALNEPAFENLDVEHPNDGPAVLTESLAYLECRVAARHATGDHELVIGQVVGGRLLSEDQPMVHVRKSGCHY
ncbi:MAG: flavin reductase family protein [Planctomycetes bacterium]|nr:flavin reductase family protein [Planctomycetota bacterium]